MGRMSEVSQHTPVAAGNAVTCLDCKVLPPFSIALCPLPAAAPELLAALEEMEAFVTNYLTNGPSSSDDFDPFHDAAMTVRQTARAALRAAIAKAKGTGK